MITRISNSKIDQAVKALRQGKAVVFPTDTSYGLAVDSTNATAVKNLYHVKGRTFKKPVHIVVTSPAMAKKYVVWGKQADALAKAFWPGALTLVLPVPRTPLGIKSSQAPRGVLGMLTVGTGFLGVRMPDNAVALSLVKKLKSPITATSANVSNMPDCYSIEEVMQQYKGKRNKPDILIDMGVLKRNKPSTVVKIDGGKVEILREGPITKKQILNRVKGIGYRV